MNRLITRLQRRSRVAVGSSMALLVSLPLGAGVGLASSATAAPSTERAAATAPDDRATASDRTEKKQRKSETESALGDAVPWTADPAASAAAAAEESFDALVFSETAAFEHSNIDEGVAAIQKLGTENNFTVTASEDSSVFTDANLEQYEVVIFLSTTGDVLNEAEQGAFERYIQAGGGYAGIHAASDTEYSWPWYGNLVGAYFNNHPPGTPNATVKVEDPAHASTAGIEPRWQRTDEWYNFRTNPAANPRTKLHVLASLDETTYAPGSGAMGAEHPIAWCQDYDGGRSWYTGMGHTEASFVEPKFLTHVLGGIQTAAGVVDSDCKATLTSSFEKVALDENTSNPMELAIAEDGRVFYIDRNGAVRIIKPNGTVVTAGTIPVYTGQEFGLLGIALDPNFATNNHVFLYFSPTGTAALDRISRFTMSGDTLQLSSEVKILDVPTQRDQCCHAGGSMEFDNDGNLYLATGDNTNPFDSGGYTPIDERPGRSAWDAQRTSGNTNSLNGKVLRIRPSADGGYTIPAGNLFPPGTEKTLPEIYAMGFRNPFRIGLDEQNNNILVADYGPDAGSVSATRGPNGRVEWNILDEPGNYGWPYCVGNNTPYNDYNFATSTAGAAFNCAAPVNDSPNNTGLTNLPAAKPAVIWQSNNASITGTPEIGASGAPMTSGTYDYDPDLASDRKWPAYFDSKAIWADWNNSRLFTVQMNQDGTNYTDINRLLSTLPMVRPHALQFGPDGALYMIEWGSGFNGNNSDSGVYRIDYVEGNRAPVARATADRTSGAAPLPVQFDGSASFDADTGDATGLSYAWDFDGDGTVDATTAKTSHTYTAAGNYTAKLTVTDADGRTGSTNIDITAGNTAPTVELVLPKDGGFFDFGDYVAYEVKVTDPEDGTIDCSKVVVQPGLGHDQHSHDYEQYQGCTGTLALPGDTGHSGANIFGTIKATYTDKGAGVAGALTGVDGIVLHTKHKEAEFFDKTGRVGTGAGTAGVTTQTTTDTGGGLNVTGVETGDWFGWDVMNLTGITGVTMRAASTTAGATFEVRQGSPTGTAIATLTVPNTGGAQTYQNVSATFTGATTTSEPLYFVATTGGANVNWLEFTGRGVTDNRPPTVAINASTTTGEVPLPVSFTSTVNDPDGDTPVSYAWKFGDGEASTSTEANPSHTYTAPGKYVVSLTVTDARGAKTTRTTEITATAAKDICFSGRSDDFVGNALDTERWNRSVRVNQSLTVADGTLNIPLTNADIYQTTNTAPNIVLQDLPAGRFEVTTKLTLPAVRGYQQGGLIVYGDDNNYLKLVYSGRSTATAGSKAANVIQFAKEVNGTASESNSTALGASFPDTVWLRMTSTDGNVVTPTYSTDGATWLPITTSNGTAAPRDLTGITAPKVGLLALGSTAAGAADNITAEFDYFTITPDDTAVECSPPCVVEEFDGNALGADWTTVRPSGNLTVSGGSVKIPMEATDLYQTTNTARDLVLRDLPEGPFVATTKVTAPINRSYQSAGLLIYGDDDNYLKHVFQGRSTDPNPASNIIQTARETAGSAVETNTPGLGAEFPTTVWLRLTSEDGEEVLGSYSTDGESWTDMAAGYSIADIAEPRIGLLSAANQAAGAGITPSFDFFTLGEDETCEPGGEEPGDTTAPTTTISIPDATGQAGWYTTRPSFTLTAADETDGSGVASTEFRIAGGAWTPYTGAVQVTGEGSRLVEYRSTDEAGNVEATKSLTVKIDTVAPTATIAVPDATGDNGWHTSRPTFTLAATDAGSGPGSLQYRLDGGDWMAYDIAVPVPGEGERLVEYRSTDVAGNISEVGSETVKVDTADPTLTARIGGDRTKTLTLTATDATSGVTRIEYRIGDATTWSTYDAPLAFDEPGAYLVRYRATDAAGNTAGGQLEVVVSEPGGPVVIPKPTVAITTAPLAANGRANWYTSPVTVTLAGAGGEGQLTLEYRIGNGPWTPYTTPFQVSDDGVNLVQARATDAAGRASAVETTTIRMDRTAPTVAISGIADNARLDLAAGRTPLVLVTLADATSGAAERVIRLDGEVVGSPTRIDPLALRNGKHTLEVTVLDAAGNQASRTVRFMVVATYGGGNRLVNRLDDEGVIGAGLSKKLVAELKAAKRADVLDERRKAVKALKRFERLASRVSDKEVRLALKRLSRTLKSQL